MWFGGVVRSLFRFKGCCLNLYTIAVFWCFVLFWGNLGAAFVGHRMGRRQFLLYPEEQPRRSGNIDTVILSLLGLLTAFTFSAAYSRYEMRRQLIVDEANAIGTAWLRLDLLPENSKAEVRIMFHRYVESRARLWSAMSDKEKALQENENGMRQQSQIWRAAVAATEGETSGDARKLLLPALNSVFDIATTRLVSIQSHPPLVIFILLAVFSLATAWLTGYGMAEADRLVITHLAGYSALACLVFILICDIEYPRFGLIRLDVPNQLIDDLESQIRATLQK
jgi:hypothetical protein